MLPLERSVHAESKSPLHQPPQLSCETAERYIYCSKLQISVNRQGIILSECKENRCGLCKRNRQVPLQRSLEFFRFRSDRCISTWTEIRAFRESGWPICCPQKHESDETAQECLFWFLFQTLGILRSEATLGLWKHAVVEDSGLILTTWHALNFYL